MIWGYGVAVGSAQDGPHRSQIILKDYGYRYKNPFHNPFKPIKNVDSEKYFA